jgi:hypothetical protein
VSFVSAARPELLFRSLLPTPQGRNVKGTSPAARTLFPETLRGTVQQCSECGAYLDVGGEEVPDGWEEEDRDGEER